MLSFAAIGADPELRYRNRKGHVLEASTFALDGNHYGFVGCDGHSATGEMRPPPAKSVHALLTGIANGLVQIKEVIGGAEAYAHPNHDAPCGGHIHVSFYATDLTFQKFLATGVVQSPIRGRLGIGVTWPRNYRVHKDSTESLASQTKAQSLTSEAWWPYPGPDQVALSMSRLLTPIELGYQPWFMRRSRNRYYGGNPLDLRSSDTVPHPNNKQHAEHPIVKYEYRQPSTWLWHPFLAYIYLAAAKLAVVNFGKVPLDDLKEEAGEFRVRRVYDSGSTTDLSEHYRKMVKTRLKHYVEEHGFRHTPDTVDLPLVLAEMEALLPMYHDIENPKPIQWDAWRKLA